MIFIEHYSACKINAIHTLFGAHLNKAKNGLSCVVAPYNWDVHEQVVKFNENLVLAGSFKARVPYYLDIRSTLAISPHPIWASKSHINRSM